MDLIWESLNSQRLLIRAVDWQLYQLGLSGCCRGGMWFCLESPREEHLAHCTSDFLPVVWAHIPCIVHTFTFGVCVCVCVRSSSAVPFKDGVYIHSFLSTQSLGVLGLNCDQGWVSHQLLCLYCVCLKESSIRDPKTEQGRRAKSRHTPWYSHHVNDHNDLQLYRVSVQIKRSGSFIIPESWRPWGSYMWHHIHIL